MPNPEQNPDHFEDWGNLMFITRRVHSMAMVFPKHPAIDKLVKATDFSTTANAFGRMAAQPVFEAVQTCATWRCRQENS